jgi:hypothetical protein
MEKKVSIKDESRIGETIAQLTTCAEKLERNLNLLDSYNQKADLINKEYIYELTTNKDEESKIILHKHLGSTNTLDNDNTNQKFNKLIKILFSQKGYGVNINDYPEIFEDLPQLDQIYFSVTHASELTNKDSFEFDYKNNKVTIKQSIIDYIIEKFTTNLTSKNKIKAFEIISNINSEMEKLKENYNINHDIITNDIYNDIFKCYKSNNSFEPKKIDYYSVYQNIILKIKD